MPVDPWFDEDGNMDFEEIQEDTSFLADLAGVSQRAKANQQRAQAHQEQKKTNKLLVDLLAEQERLNALPKCTNCGGAIPKRGVKVCMHCNTELQWQKVRGSVYTPEEAAEVRRQIAEQKKVEREARKAREAKKKAWAAERDRLRELAKKNKEEERRKWLLTKKGQKWSKKQAERAKKGGERAKRNVEERKLRVGIYGEEAVSENEAAIRKIRQSNSLDTLFMYPFYVALVVSVLSVGYGAFALFSWIVGSASYQSIPNWLHYSILLGPLACFCLAFLMSLLADAVTESRIRSITLAIPESDHLGATRAAPVTYWLKRGETIRGPFDRAAIFQIAKARKLMTGDQIAASKDGPWKNVTKEQLQQMQ